MNVLDNLHRSRNEPPRSQPLGMESRATPSDPEGLDRLETSTVGPVRLALVAVALAAAIALAVVLASQPRELSINSAEHAGSHAPAPTNPRIPTPKAPPVHFDRVTGKFSADGLEGTLPVAWFARQNEYITIGTGVGGCFGNACHPNSAGQHPLEDNLPWGAQFEAVTVEDSLTGNGLNQTADKILSYWTRSMILSIDVSGPVKIKNARKRTLTTNLPRPVRMITAEVHCQKSGMRISYDHFYLLVVKGTAGQYIAFVATWSDNATADVTNRIQDSINTLRVV
jgi:hypothetical protein